jgi:hypothetical protein
MCVCPHACFDDAHSGLILLNLAFETFIKTCWGNPYLIKIGQIYKEIYLETNMQVLLLPATLNHHKIPLRVKLYQAVRITLEAEILREHATKLCFT